MDGILPQTSGMIFATTSVGLPAVGLPPLGLLPVEFTALGSAGGGNAVVAGIVRDKSCVRRAGRHHGAAIRPVGCQGAIC